MFIIYFCSKRILDIRINFLSCADIEVRRFPKHSMGYTMVDFRLNESSSNIAELIDLLKYPHPAPQKKWTETSLSEIN